MSGPLLGRGALWFDSCERPLSLYCILGGRLRQVRLKCSYMNRRSLIKRVHHCHYGSRPKFSLNPEFSAFRIPCILSISNLALIFQIRQIPDARKDVGGPLKQKRGNYQNKLYISKNHFQFHSKAFIQL